MPMRYGLFDWVEHHTRLAPGEVFAHKLALAEAADNAGFHAYMLAEHQGTPLSIDASPALLLAAMSQRTRRLRLGALTFCLPWYDPYRFYNEVCMLDQLSGGRLELGVGRGVSPIESLIFGLADTEASRARYRETLEVFFQACSSSTLNFDGRHFRYRDVELYNKPVQKPYPPLWFPSSNKDSIEFTARHGYHTAVISSHAEAKVRFTQYREVWERNRNEPDRHNAHVAEPFLARTQHLVIAESGKEAVEAGVRAYETWKSHIHHLTRKHGRPDVMPLDPFSETSVMRLVAGSPENVLRQLKSIVAESGMNYLLCVFSFGDLPPAVAMRSLELFAAEVRPRL
ncbi:MAG TPA: LLM class flavin-dependent oxidoreductase [Burkholderiales bacterium]|nr:LLM class flavin-dependent oxidoreductase [Burkholderiales bacterium]